MSRIRQIKPAFFKDPDMAALPPAVRLFYIGLWTLADDAGYYRWDVAEVGVELFGFDPRGRRERNAVTYRDELVRAERLTLFPCGHLLIPTLQGHQRLAGPTKRVLTYEREHLKCAVPTSPDEPRDSPQVPADPRTGIGKGTGKGTERNGSVEGSAALAPEGAPRDDETESEFRRRAGLPNIMVPEAVA